MRNFGLGTVGLSNHYYRSYEDSNAESWEQIVQKFNKRWHRNHETSRNKRALSRILPNSSQISHFVRSLLWNLWMFSQVVYQIKGNWSKAIGHFFCRRSRGVTFMVIYLSDRLLENNNAIRRPQEQKIRFNNEGSNAKIPRVRNPNIFQRSRSNYAAFFSCEWNRVPNFRAFPKSAV